MLWSALTLLGAPVRAQSTTTLLPSAAVLPVGEIRVRVLSAFTRFDELLGGGDTLASPRNLADALRRDSVGVTQLPLLAPAQTAIQSLVGPTFRLTAGNLTATANSRILTAPLIVEYGLSRRLTVGFVVPLVETRTNLFQQLNPRPGAANVGPNPALTNSAQLANNAALVASLRAAAGTLQQRLDACQSSPGDPGCSTLLSQQSAISSLIQSTSPFATALETLYGTDSSHPGQTFVPLGATQASIDAQIANFRTQYAQFLGSDVLTGSIAGAGGPAARAQLQALMTSFGRDTLQTTNRTSIGDVSIGATYQLVNTFGDTLANGRNYRLAVNGTYRFGTGEPADRNRFFDIGTGYGQPGVVGTAAADVQFGRLVASVVGSYTLQLGSVDVGAVPNPGNAFFPLGPAVPGSYSAGNVISLSLTPRYRVSGAFSVDGGYTLLHVGADQYSGAGVTVGAGLPATTAQQVGFGFTYSSLVAGDRAPGRLPFEVTFSHLETLAASGGSMPKDFRDQVELRVYYHP
jgi:hypothetical protein